MPRRFDLTTDYLDLIGEVNKDLPETVAIARVTQTLSQRYNRTVTLHFTVLYRGHIRQSEDQRTVASKELLDHSNTAAIARAIAAEIAACERPAQNH